jgi:hypothetical protein
MSEKNLCHAESGEVFAERLSSVCRADTIIDNAGQGY